MNSEPVVLTPPSEKTRHRLKASPGQESGMNFAGGAAVSETVKEGAAGVRPLTSRIMKVNQSRKTLRFMNSGGTTELSRPETGKLFFSLLIY